MDDSEDLSQGLRCVRQRSLSWPLINVPVQVKTVAEGDELDGDCDDGAEAGSDTISATKPGTSNGISKVMLPVRRGDLCCGIYGCSECARTNPGRCCCEVAALDRGDNLRKNPAVMRRDNNRRGGNLFSRLLHFRKRDKNNTPTKSGKVMINGQRYVNGSGGGGGGVVNGGGGEVTTHSVGQKKKSDHHPAKETTAREEKKPVTSSPTFQQLILTRRLLCRHYYPEGGWGVVIIIVAVLVQTITHGLHLSFGILLLPTSRRFHTRWYHTSE